MPKMTSESERKERAKLLSWLSRLIDKHGDGEYIVRVKSDGNAFVKIPQSPVRYDYKAE